MVGWSMLIVLFCIVRDVCSTRQTGCVLEGVRGKVLQCTQANGTDISVSEALQVETGSSCVCRCPDRRNVYTSMCRSGQWNEYSSGCRFAHADKILFRRGKRGFFSGIGHVFKSVVQFVGSGVQKITCLFGVFCDQPRTDPDPPVFSVVKNIFVSADLIQTTASNVTWPVPTARDAVDAKNTKVVQTGGPGQHFTFGEGRTPVTYYTKDSTGNGISISFGIYVKVLRCSPPISRYPNGYYVCHPSSDFVLGTRCTYGCYSGYKLHGVSVKECLKKNTVGMWNTDGKPEDEPFCEKIKCDELRNATVDVHQPSGTRQPTSVSCTDGIYFKSKCTYECPKGYAVQKGMSRVRVCTADGTWRGGVPVCVDSEPPRFKSCPSYQTFFTMEHSSYGHVLWPEPEANENLSNISGTVAAISNNSSVEAGSYKVVITPTDLANNTGQACTFKVVVRELRCPTPYPHPHMNVSCPDGYGFGSQCNFVCESGFGLSVNDSKSTKCDKPMHASIQAKYVQWNNQQPFCHPKVFEMVLLPHLPALKQTKTFPNRQQMAYQSGLSATHASFNLQETVYHYHEQDSDVHVILLDSSEAFDSVWHNGLKLKLYENGVDGKLWTLFDQLYCGMSSFIQLEKTTCPEIDPPDNGALTCDLWENGRFCQMQCMIGTDFPPTISHNRLFVCVVENITAQNDTVPKYQARWNIATKIPECSKIRNPRQLHGRMKFYAYFNGSCSSDEAQKEIIINFITALNKSSYTEVSLGRIHNIVNSVKVTCGTVTVVKRSVNQTRRSKYEADVTLQLSMDSSHDLEQQFYENRHIIKGLAERLRHQFQSNTSAFIPFHDNFSEMGVADWDVAVNCPKGLFPSLTTYSCVGCVRGSYYDETKGQCEQCPEGEYTDSPDQTVCKKCPLHTTTIMTGATAISQCEDLCQPGYFSTNGVEPCSPCEAGFYQQSRGSSACLQCPGGQTTPTEGSDSVDICEEFDMEFTDSSDSSASLEVSVEADVGNSLTLSFWLRSLDTHGHVLTMHPNKSDMSFFVEDGFLLSRILGSGFTSKVALDDSKWHQHVVYINSGVVEIFSDGMSLEKKTLNENFNIIGFMTLEMGGKGFRGSISQVNIHRGQTTPPFNKCFSERGDILAWPMFSNADLTGSFLQIPSECDDQDDCVSSPCHHGECHDSLGGYTCTCEDGFTGGDCEVNIDDCGGHVCANNGTCVDGVTDYTCLCTPYFTGELCDDHLVHGEWGDWGNWTFCTEDCGGGTRNRSRRCDNPLPQNGGEDCEGSPNEEGSCNTDPCPVCHDVSPPTNGSFDCTHIDNMLYCNVTCDEGYDFDIPALSVYECGDVTGYEWNFHTDEHPYHRLPNCMEMSPPERMTIHYDAEYIDLTCDKVNEESTKTLIRDVLTPQIESVPCVLDGHCQLESVLVSHCDGEDRKERSPAAGFTITVSSNTSTADMGIKVEGLRIAMVHLNDSATGGIFTVNRGGKDFFLNHNSGTFTGDVKCPTGLQRNNAFCTPCGQGTYLHQGYCQVCEKGHYQDLIGQDYCKMCPLGKTTKGRGSVTTLECDVDEETSIHGVGMGTAVLAGTLSSVCLVTTAVVILLYWKLKSRDHKVDALSMELSKIQRDGQFILQRNTHFQTTPPVDSALSKYTDQLPEKE